MDRERTLQAIARIEAALVRLEAASRGASVGPNPALVRQHEALRRSVSASLSELDVLIGALEQ